MNELDDFDILLEEQNAKKMNNEPVFEVTKEMFEIKFEDVKLIRLIGSGGSDSEVFEGLYLNNKCAVKIFRVEIQDQTFFEEFEKELKVVSVLRNKFICQFYGVCLKMPRIGIISEFCSNGKFSDYILSLKECKNEEIIRLLFEISCGMHYLHSVHIIHRDLKSGNVLINSEIIVKIIDFGLSKISYGEEDLTKCIGTYGYIAPEVIRGENYTNKCDVFSYSIIIYEALIRFKSNAYGGQFDITTGSIDINVSQDENYRPSLDKIKNKENFPWLIKMMKNCWKSDPNERPSFKTITEVFQNDSKLKFINKL